MLISILVYCYREELERYRETGVLTYLCVCFSRDEQDSGQPRYVQDNIKANAGTRLNLISRFKNCIFERFNYKKKKRREKSPKKFHFSGKNQLYKIKFWKDSILQKVEKSL